MLGYDNNAYERKTSLDGIQRRDAYVVNPRTGERKLVKKEMRSFAQMSPDGRFLLFWDDGNYHVQNIATGAVTNVTKGAPVSFINLEDDHNVDRPPTQVVGWSKDANAVLISDNWDVWKVPVTGAGHVNLTGDGKAKKIRYSRRINTDPRERGIDLTKPIYMVAMQIGMAIIKKSVVKPSAGKFSTKPLIPTAEDNFYILGPGIERASVSFMEHTPEILAAAHRGEQLYAYFEIRYRDAFEHDRLFGRGGSHDALHA